MSSGAEIGRRANPTRRESDRDAGVAKGMPAAGVTRVEAPEVTKMLEAGRGAEADRDRADVPFVRGIIIAEPVAEFTPPDVTGLKGLASEFAGLLTTEPGAGAVKRGEDVAASTGVG